MNLVIGKFCPPHSGHQYLIEQAIADDETLVLVLWSSAEPISWRERVAWIEELYDGWDIGVDAAQDELPVDFNDPQVTYRHAHLIAQHLGSSCSRITKVFGSEIYVDDLADYFGAQAVCVDPERTTHPISGTAIRKDIRKGWEYLSPVVRKDLCKRVVCIGPESCGTTTLARDLAQHYGTVWAPEYGRLYSEGIKDHPWEYEDLLHIWEQQGELEDRMAARAKNGLLICDTNQLATKVWEEFLVGSPMHLLYGRSPDMYLLTNLCPWEDDGLREGERFRLKMMSRIMELLDRTGVPWYVMSGTPTKRLQNATQFIDQLSWSI